MWNTTGVIGRVHRLRERPFGGWICLCLGIGAAIGIRVCGGRSLGRGARRRLHRSTSAVPGPEPLGQRPEESVAGE